MLPSRFRLSKSSTTRFAFIKSKTGITPNILARFAIMLAIKDGVKANTEVVSQVDTGQEINLSSLFGDQSEFYSHVIDQYISDFKLTTESIHDVVVSLVDIGVYKMGHIKSLEDLESIVLT